MRVPAGDGSASTCHVPVHLISDLGLDLDLDGDRYEPAPKMSTWGWTELLMLLVVASCAWLFWGWVLGWHS